MGMNQPKPLKYFRYIILAENSKAPDPSYHPRGHLDAVDASKVEGFVSNYGIVLDSQYLVVDIDSPGDADYHFLDSLPGTWTQITKKGTHYLYRVPVGYVGKNTKLVNDEGVIYGDLKVKGYIVGPGSTINGHTYELIVDREPVLAPDFLLSQLSLPLRVQNSTNGTKTPSPGSKKIPKGGHDDFLTSFGGFLAKHGLSADGIYEGLKGVRTLLADEDELRPYTDEILRQKAVKMALWTEDPEKYELLAADIENGVDFDFPILDWYLHEFIPRGGYLVTGYAAGGTGKSSFGHKLAALVTQRGDNFMVLNHEDTPQYWKACAVIAGAERERLFNPVNPLAFKTPRDSEALEKWIVENNIKVVWLDSVKDHFEAAEGDTATHTRNALSPLASIASRLGVLIIGIFHTTKKGEYSGSTEMLNVARHVLEFERKQDSYLTMRVRKTNLRQPTYALRMPAEEQDIIDPQDESKKFLERLEDGTIVTRKAWVITEIVKDDKAYTNMLKEQQKREEWDLIKPLHDEGLSTREIEEKLGISKSAVHRRVQEFSGDYIDLDDV
jgi:hypothetical protein